jgi:signal transduction histidine kinase
MLLTAAARGDDQEKLRSGVAEAVRRLEEEIDGLRGLIRELRPAALDELGPAAAIEGLAARVSERNDILVQAAVRLTRRRYPPELETALYRIVQEAVNNAVRHSGAEHVTVDVSEECDGVYVRVSDDGAGFDPSAPDDGFGITGMRERVALLRGDLEVTSSPGGTTVTAVLPVGQAI